MANFRVTLSDHTQGSTDQLRQLISRHLQDFFNEVFAGTSDGATVTWGTAAASDALVIHFVEDVASSYISQRMPGSAHRPDGGGFTREQRGVTGSEFYKLVLTGGTPSRYNATGYAKIAFHEAMHNKTGWPNYRLHGQEGGDGLAASPPHLPLTDTNKTLMRGAMARTNQQLL